MTDWEKFLERRKANIGFISRGKAFREPSEFEKAQALAKEITSWQESIGVKTFKVGESYSISHQPKEIKQIVDLNRAIDAYINTPMDKDGILASQGIDVEQFKWKEVGIVRAFIYWITGRKVRRKND